MTVNTTIGAPAVWAANDGVYVALQDNGAKCPSDKPGKGLVVLKIRADPAPAIDTAWCASVPSLNGSPIVTTTDGRSNPIVFMVSPRNDGRLHAFNGDTGEPLVSPPDQMIGLHGFQTLIAADGRLYVAADGRVYAFTF